MSMTPEQLAEAQAANRAKWAAHNDAIMRAPRNGFERALTDAYRALETYAAAHLDRYESPIGEDYVFGAAWADMARAFRSLLGGESGRFECGEMDGRVLALATRHGVDLEA